MAEKANNSHPSKRDNAWWKNKFYRVLIAVALIGGGCAFLIPPFITSYGSGDSLPILRQTILAATGGVLAILTLWENRRKNDQEHMRQVHAERRSRYAKAVEQLADEKAPIRLGSVYTLVKLVDDWLDDEKTLPSKDERRQEGQIIVNSLCAYIRSSFPLAERHNELTLSYKEYQQKCRVNHNKNQDTRPIEDSITDSNLEPEEHQDNKQPKQSHEDFIRDKSLFQEEQEVRQTILSEIKKRLINDDNYKHKDSKYEVTPGTWSCFEYDFSNAIFFYSVNLSEVNFSGKKNSFSEAEFIQPVDFSGTIFHEVTDFSRTRFHKEVKFSEVHPPILSEIYFPKNADSYRAHFYGVTKFSEVHFFEEANFSKAHFSGVAEFSGATFHKDAKFFEARFSHEDGTDTSVARVYKYIYGFCRVNFSGATFHKGTDFSRAHFYEDTDFSLAKFHEDARFPGAHFHGKKTYFSGATFHKFNFCGAHFYRLVTFSGTTFHKFDSSEAHPHWNTKQIHEATFSVAHFDMGADFSGAYFHEDTSFFWAHFYEGAIFANAYFYKVANFSGAHFHGSANFSEATFCSKPIFASTADLPWEKPSVSRFSCKVEHNFDIQPDNHKIEIEEHRSPDGTITIIPQGCVVFDSETGKVIPGAESIHG